MLLWAQIVPAAEKNREANICPTKWKKMTFEAYFMREIAIYSESLTMIEKERKTDNKKEHDFATLLLESHCSELQKYKQGKIGLKFVDM